MPFAYVAHLRTFILLWLMFLAPLFAANMGWCAPIAMAPVIILFLGLDSISGEIENPFGYDWNDLPLDSVVAQVVSDIIEVCPHALHSPAALLRTRPLVIMYMEVGTSTDLLSTSLTSI
jgi:predicted membrane chloride channel (bestrophin family)